MGATQNVSVAEAETRALLVWRQTLVLHAVAVTHDDPWLCFPLSTETENRSRSVVSWSVYRQLPAYRPKRSFLLL